MACDVISGEENDTISPRPSFRNAVSTLGRIHRKNNANPEGNWIDVTDDFDISVSGRKVLVTPKTGNFWGAWKVYRIRPVAGERKCLLVAGTPDVAGDEYILYTVETSDPG